MTTGSSARRCNHQGIFTTRFEEMQACYRVVVGMETSLETEIPLGTCDAHGISTSMYLPAPDGNIVELRIDNFGDWDKSSGYMHSGMTKGGPYGANPRGAGSVDFDKMIDAYEAGATVEQLFLRAFEGEFAPAEVPDMRSQL